jgi:hypothetical protein
MGVVGAPLEGGVRGAADSEYDPTLVDSLVERSQALVPGESTHAKQGGDDPLVRRNRASMPVDKTFVTWATLQRAAASASQQIAPKLETRDTGTRTRDAAGRTAGRLKEVAKGCSRKPGSAAWSCPLPIGEKERKGGDGKAQGGGGLFLKVVGAGGGERGWSRRLSFGAAQEVYQGQRREKKRMQMQQRAAEVGGKHVCSNTYLYYPASESEGSACLALRCLNVQMTEKQRALEGLRHEAEVLEEELRRAEERNMQERRLREAWSAAARFRVSGGVGAARRCLLALVRSHAIVRA